ncbi:MAG: SH3 domain-containing protein, partial [Nocardioides sp.]
LATLSTVGAGVLAASPETRNLLVANSSSSISGSVGGSVGGSASGSLSGAVDLSERLQVVSRSASRIDRLTEVELMMTAPAIAQAIRQADTHRWTTSALNLWTAPDRSGTKVGIVEEGTKVLVTGRAAADRVELVMDGKSRWVSAGYLAAEKPKPEPEPRPEPEPQVEAEPEPEPEPEQVGLGGACTNGTSVSGSANVLGVHQAVCAAFPEITAYGTYRSDGEHAQGIAIDIMVSGARGWEVAEYLRANYSALGISYVMYSQKIWSVDRSGEGWRYVEDRGSVTANHYDHVHVTTY